MGLARMVAHVSGGSALTEPASQTSKPPRASLARILRRGALVVAFAVAGFLLFCVAGLIVVQRSMIYPGWKAEEPNYGKLLPDNVATLEYRGDGGERLVAYYVEPANGADPERLWVMFHGNLSTALDWLDFVETVPDDAAGFLLVDYPGYGVCEGKPSRAGIVAGGEAAYAALARHLGTTTADLDERANAMGFSLGAAAAMEFAVRHPVRRVVLLAPFTSLKAMADGIATPALSWLLRDRYDNMARLAELANREAPPDVHIFHGTADDIIPFAMSERLAASAPSVATLHPVERADHNWLLEAARDDVKKAMTEGSDSGMKDEG